MASPNEKDEFPILLPVSEARPRANTRALNSRNRSVSFSNSTYSTNRVDNSSVVLGYTGPLRTQRRPPLSVQMSGPLYSTRRPDQSFFPASPVQPPDSSLSSSTVDVPSEEDEVVLKNANLLKSGQLGMCNDPYCTTCPSYYNRQAAQFHTNRVVSDSRFRTALYDDARGWAKRFASSVRKLIPGIMNPHSKFVQMRVREAERFNWAATRGVNEELLFENMPDDLQRDIKRHLFKFLKKVRIFSLMDESILDAIRERLKQRTYIRSSTVLHRKGLVEKMVFIVRGEMESIGEDGSVLPLSEGDVCGEELLTWCLERSSVNPDGTRIKMPTKGLVSNRNVRCVTNVEAFSLSVADLEDVTSLFSRFLRSHRVQGAIRYESPYWRLRAAMQIQVAWRYRKKRLERLLLQDNRVMKEIT
ncbi:hypothetical protein F2Q68_00017465 [Brassica cretica]|uniref:Cyclic nucleotide-binding domain-containing protein n=1 Tax=Brassica cretica TaxID=69181 RepID=A0A8S9HJ52_BRACR|nr:hypothetical protein F2Q68_00017465 [Brassica cretica]